MSSASTVAGVLMWGRQVGAVAADAEGRVSFEYDPAFRAAGLELSPLHLPLAESRRATAGPDGLPGLLADCLPDRFGTAVIARHFAAGGHGWETLNPVRKLLLIGHRTLGALEFEPAEGPGAEGDSPATLDIPALLTEARSIADGTARPIPELMRAGVSAGGDGPKVLVLRDAVTGALRSGAATPRAGEEHWILKLDGVGDPGAPDFEPRQFSRIEHAYTLMARATGIAVAETLLLEEGLRTHLLVRRFDRTAEGRLHMHSLAGLQHIDRAEPGSYSYEGLLRTVQALRLDYTALEEAWRRAVFNLAAFNQNDHPRSFWFLMDAAGRWSLAPACGVTFARGTPATTRHQLTLNGKREKFTRQDLLDVGKRLRLRKSGADVIDQVRAALDRWPEFAAAAGLPRERIAGIGEAFRPLG